MNCPNCNNKCEKCGCNDAPLTTPNYVLPECNNPDTCSEIINTNCVVYTGDPITSGNTVVVNTNDTVSEALENIVNSYSSILPYKSYVANVTINGTIPNPVQNVDIVYNNLGTVTWAQDLVDCKKFLATLNTPASNSLVAFTTVTSSNIVSYKYNLEAYANSLSEMRVNIYNPDETCPTVGIMSFLIEIRAY